VPDTGLMPKKIIAMKKLLLLISLFGLAPVLKAEDSTMVRLKRFFTNISAYDNMYTQEKVYLHLDNNGYFPGEKIWFKAYVLTAGRLLPTDLSRILYVDLLMPDGTVWDRKILPIHNGRTYGEFDLSDLLRTGFYEIRAYTRAMTNWDAAYVYSRVIPIFNPPKDTVSFAPLDLDLSAPLFKNRLRRSQQAAPLIAPSAQQQKGHILTFYPEGGNLVKGLPGRVAFKLTDGRGLPIEDELVVCGNDDRQIDKVRPIHEGMGLIELPENWSGGYAAIAGEKGEMQRFPLPKAVEEGCTMKVESDSNGDMKVIISPNDRMLNRKLGISITCRGMACFFDTVNTDRSCIIKKIPRKQLHDGILQTTLFTSEGQVVCERLSWCIPQKPPLVLATRQSGTSFQPFNPIALEFYLKDQSGVPLEGDFSLSVQDCAGNIAESGADLRTDMLLCSDLKGYIEHPEYYLASNDEKRLKDLDLLLMVQGWRRYEWKQMSGVRPFKLKQPAEDKQIFDGWVVDMSKKQRPLPDFNLSMLLVRYDGISSFKFSDTKTNADGSFAFSSDEEIYGDLLGSFVATNDKDKRLKAHILLNRNFSPHPQPYEWLQYRYFKSPKQLPESVVRTPETFKWIDTLSKVRHLPPVKVAEKESRFTPPFGTRWTYYGGENAARRAHSCIYFNIEEELQQYLDSVGFEPDIYDWIEQVMPDFTHEKDQPGKLTYRGRDVFMFYDNLPSPPPNHTGAMSEFRSLFITGDPQAPNMFGKVRTRTTNNVTLLFYSEVGNDFTNTFKKGMRNTVIHGYSKVSDFYSPDYRVRDTPSSADRRRTLFWSPSLTTNKDGRASVVFFNNFREGTRIKIDAQGIAVNGQLFSNEN